MNVGVVTGASSGIGREFVVQIFERYSKLDEIWVIARRANRLEELAEELNCKEGCRCRVRVMALDLTSGLDLDKLKTELESFKPQVQLLVNCAGFGKKGTFELGDYESQIGMIDLNCRALAAVTYIVLPYMKERGRIFQVASMAAFLPQPGFAIYASSKAFVLSFSRALKYELHSRKINVTAICPGPVDTEFFETSDYSSANATISKNASTNPSENKISKYKKMFLVKPEKVVAKALKDSSLGYEISIYSWPMKIVYIASKIIPHKVILKILYERS